MTVCQFVITSTTGQRRRLPRKQIVDATWAEVCYGGFADWTINTSAGFKELTTIVSTDIMEVFVDGDPEPFFRGKVNSRRRQRGAPSNLTLSGYGRFLQAGSHVCQKRYSYYGGADISRPFSDVATDAILPKEPGLTLAPALVGQTTDSLDAYNQRTQDIYNNLTKLTGNGAVWGVDVNTDPNDAHYLSDELYIRPISTVADFGLPASARRITSGETEERTDQLLNVAVFVGGPPMYPNLLYNNNWVRPVFSGNGVGNLLQSPGFEDQQNWSLGAGAAYKVTGKQEGGTYAGNWMVELDNVGEYFEQTVNNCGLVAGHTLVFAGHTRREHGDDHCTAKMELFWRDAGNNETLGSVVLDGTVINPVGDAWVYYNQPAQIPAGATGYRLRVTLLTIGTDDANPGHTPGMVWDEMEVFDAGVVRQDGWGLNRNGDAEVLAQNWQVEGGNGADGDSTAYAVYVKVHASDADGHDVHLARPGPQNSPAFTAVANGQYAYGRFLKLAPGVAASPKMYLQTETFDGSGKQLGGYNRQTIPANALTNEWQWFEVNCSLGPDASQANADLVFRGDGECLIGAGAFRDIGAVVADPVAFCIPDGNLQLTLRAADIMPQGSPEQQSTSVYGEWADIITESSITTRADAITYMIAQFKARATPPVSPVLEVIYDGKKFRTGLNVKLIGQDADVLFPVPMLPIVKVTWRWDGQLHATLELSNPKPDMGDNILAKIAKANALGVLATASAATSNSAGTSGGGVGITAGAQFFGSLEHTADDPTLHDDFRTGPHVSDAEHTLIGGATQKAVNLSDLASAPVARINLGLGTAATQSTTAFDTAGSAATVQAASLQKSSNLSDLGSASTARTNLGLGSAAVANLPAAGSNASAVQVVRGDDNRLLGSCCPAWEMQGIDSSLGGTAAFNPTDISPTWSSRYFTPTGDLAFNTANSSLQPIAYEQRVVLYTRLKVAAAKTIQITVRADNACRVLLNGARVGTDTNDTNTTYSLSLVVGWNTLALCYQNGQGDSYELIVSGVGGTLASLVDRMAGYLPVAAPSASGAGGASLVTQLPTPSAATRGQFYLLSGGSGDVLYYGIQASGGGYALQSVPAGTLVTAPFVPTSVAGCQLWLPADKLTYASGANVASWPDQSTNAYTGTGSGTPVPTFATGADGSLPAVTFGGGKIATTCPSATGAFTVFAVVRPTAAPGGGATVFGTAASGGFDLRIDTGGMEVLAETTSSLRSEGYGAVPLNTWVLLAFRVDGSGNYSFYRGNVSSGTTATASGNWGSVTFTASTLVVGNNPTSGSSEQFNGQVGEVLQYNAALSTSDFAKVVSYLKAKWTV